MQAYMNGGGVKGLIGDDEDEDGKGQMNAEEEKMIEDEFNEIYTDDPKLRELLGNDPS